jgi:Ca2+-binding EF-hand superfamily protein
VKPRNTTALVTALLALLAAAALAPAAQPPSQAAGGGSSSDSQDQAAAVLANNDLDADGVVTKAEATSAGGRLIRSWDKVDLNKDGKVDKAEIARNLASIQKSGDEGGSRSEPQDQAAAVLANNDLNEDGVVTKAEAASAGGRLIASWDKVDLNKDGKVDKAEIAKSLASLQKTDATAPSGSKGSAAPAKK